MPFTLADLTADPLPATGIDELVKLEPEVWKAVADLKTWKWSQNSQDPPGQLALSGRAMTLWACATRVARETQTQSVAARTAACLSYVAGAWSEYALDHRQPAYDRGRTAYAYAVTSLGPDPRKRLDEALALIESPQTAPISHKAKELFASSKSSPSEAEIYRAVLDAAIADPAFFSRTNGWVDYVSNWSRKSADQVGARLEPRLATCVHFPGARPTSLSTMTEVATNQLVSQLTACDLLTNLEWGSYRTSGSAASWKAAVLVYRYGVARALSGCGGPICRNEWVDGMRLSIKD